MTRSTCIHAYLHKLFMPGHIVSMSHVAGMMLHTRAVHPAIILTVTGQHSCLMCERRDYDGLQRYYDGWIYSCYVVMFCISLISLILMWKLIFTVFLFLSPHKGNYCLLTLSEICINFKSLFNKQMTKLSGDVEEGFANERNHFVMGTRGTSWGTSWS